MVSEADATHPGPLHADLPAAIVRELIEHARTEDPNEACGLVIGSGAAAAGGRALRFERTRNAAASPYRYEIDSKDLLRLTLEADDRDEVFWAIVHSHTHTPARPSPTDIGLALYPDALYILVSLAEVDELLEEAGSAAEGDAVAAGADATGVRAWPSVRAWRIVDRTLYEVRLEVTE